MIDWEVPVFDWRALPVFDSRLLPVFDREEVVEARELSCRGRVRVGLLAPHEANDPSGPLSGQRGGAPRLQVGWEGIGHDPHQGSAPFQTGWRKADG